MSDNFRKRLKRFMDEYRKRGLSLEEIYQEAPLRQLLLVSLCFDSCVASGIDQALAKGTPIENVKAMGLLPSYAQTISEVDMVRAKDFYPKNRDIESLSIAEMLKIRNQLTSYLEGNCKVIFIADGHIKSQARTVEKAKEAPDGSVLSINDVNRLTVVSEDLTLLDRFADNLKKRTTPETLCAKDGWEMKYFGLLSKSNYVFIDGFPAEVHLNEPKQSMLSAVMTHLVYEVMRADTMTSEGESNFNESFRQLPALVGQSIEDHKSKVSSDDLRAMQSLHKELSGMVREHTERNIKEKYQCLLEFHRKAHETFFGRSPEWKEVYEEAKQEYIQEGGGGVLTQSNASKGD